MLTVKQIISRYEAAHDVDKEEGHSAYLTYKQIMQAIADKYSTPFVATVEAFVALSPNSDYRGNLRSLVSVIEFMQGTTDKLVTSGYNHCAVRALSYLNGSVSFSDTVKGLKIICFRHNILYPNTSKRCTIDGHMAHILGGTTGTMKQVNMTPKLYGTCEKLMTLAANRLGLLPHQLQATLWLDRKNREGILGATQGDLFREDFNGIHVYVDNLKGY